MTMEKWDELERILNENELNKIKQTINGKIAPTRGQK